MTFREYWSVPHEFYGTANSPDQKTVNLPIIKTCSYPLLHEVGGNQDARREMKGGSPQGMDHRQMSGGISGKDGIAITLDQTISARGKHPLHQTLPFPATLNSRELGQRGIELAIECHDFKASPL